MQVKSGERSRTSDEEGGSELLRVRDGRSSGFGDENSDAGNSETLCRGSGERPDVPELAELTARLRTVGAWVGVAIRGGETSPIGEHENTPSEEKTS